MAKEWAKSFYNSGEWKEARQRALRRDGFTCHYCGATATEVHHIIELTKDNISDTSVSLNQDNLMSLCHACHAALTMQEHGIKDMDCGIEYHFDGDGNLILNKNNFSK